MNLQFDKKLNYDNIKSETVLILQGGGSLGAYECGVFKTLNKHNIVFDLLAGSSIGAVNASIICSAQNDNKNAATILENFWLDIAENIFPSPINFFTNSTFYDEMMAMMSYMYSMLYGNYNFFIPRWFFPVFYNYFYLNWNYLYDITPLKYTLKKYINLDSINLPSEQNERKGSRLIITATDIQKGVPVVFDNKKTKFDEDTILSSVGFPFYGLKWRKIDGKFLWDGSLLTNTPMMDVIYASPQFDKNYYIVDLFPREQMEIPSNMMEVWHRARDIIFMDKTDKNIQLIKEIEKYLTLLKKINSIIKDNDAKLNGKTKRKLEDLEPEYKNLVDKRGAFIKNVVRIGRKEKMQFLFEDADFSTYRIKKLIREGEEDAERILTQYQNK